MVNTPKTVENELFENIVIILGIVFINNLFLYLLLKTLCN